jgi:hypothetical protein
MIEELDETLAISNIYNTDIDTQEREYILPRPAWNNQILYFRILFKVKKALDSAEKKT